MKHKISIVIPDGEKEKDWLNREIQTTLEVIKKDTIFQGRLDKRISIKTSYYDNVVKITKKIYKRLAKNQKSRVRTLVPALIITADTMLARHIASPNIYWLKSKRGVLSQNRLAKILHIRKYKLSNQFHLVMSNVEKDH